MQVILPSLCIAFVLCLKDLTLCQPDTLKSAQLMERFSIKLYQIRKEDRLCYCCLSYCWGGDQPVKTTLSSLQARVLGIIFSELPQTLRDAILITLRLGLRFIWIACLFIIQDGADDIGVEIGLMLLILKRLHHHFTVKRKQLL